MEPADILTSYLALRHEIAQVWSVAAKDFDLGSNQIRLLFRLFQSSATMTELAEAAFIDKASASRTITLLEKGGIVKRVGDKDDGRIVRIELSPKGRVIARKAVAIRRKVSRELDDRLSVAERKQFADLISKITQSPMESIF